MMKTTQRKALKAYIALLELMKMSFQLTDGLKIMKLKKAMDYIYEFQVQEENKLAEEFQPEMRDGKYTFVNDPDSAREFQARLNEIGNMEIELEVQPINIRIAGNEGIRLAPETLLALDDFVIFDE